MATYTLYPIQTTVSPPSLTSNAVEGLDVVVGAVIAGIALYFLNKSFLNNVPAYIAIVVGFMITMYLGQYGITRSLGFALLADGFYKLIKEYVTVSS